MFANVYHNRDFSSFLCLPKHITMEDNDILCEVPTMGELKKTIFAMSSDSSPSLDGMSGMFCYYCWDIIA